MNEEIKNKIESLVTGIGATAEFLGVMRKALEANGFTREESVDMCTELLLAMIFGANRGETE